MSLTSCTNGYTVTVLKQGTFSVTSTSSHSGTLTLEGFETTVKTPLGFNCIYSGSATVSLNGGAMADIVANSTAITRTGHSAFCGSNGEWNGTLTVSAPEPLYVEPQRVAILCKTASDPCSGGAYPIGTAVEASLKSGTQSILTTPFGQVKCNNSTIKGEVSGSAEGISLSSVSFGGCNCGVETLKSGDLGVKATGEHGGTLSSTGMETSVACLERECIYATNATSAGALKGGSMAALVIEATLPRTGGSAECGGSGTWKAEYTVTAPEPLYLEKETTPSTSLCKIASDPCPIGNSYPTGTVIEASTSAGSHSKVIGPLNINIQCAASIKGEVTNAGGKVTNVSGVVASMGFTSCTNGYSVTVLKNGTFLISSVSSGSGTLTLDGFETTVQTPLGFNCIYSGPATVNLDGGAMAGIVANASAVLRTGHSAFCGPKGEWNANLTVTAPEPLYVEGV